VRILFDNGQGARYPTPIAGIDLDQASALF
jgi:hypothetical protein